MAGPHALFCTFLLLVIASLQVQADSPCTRRCPQQCEKKGATLDCLSTCVKQCGVGEHDGKIWIPGNKPEVAPSERRGAKWIPENKPEDKVEVEPSKKRGAKWIPEKKPEDKVEVEPSKKRGAKWIPENKPEATPAEEAANQNNDIPFIEDKPEKASQKKKGKSKLNKKKKQPKADGKIVKEPSVN